MNILALGSNDPIKANLKFVFCVPFSKGGENALDQFGEFRLKAG